MRKNTLGSVLLGLLSMLAVACGDAGAFDEDLEPSEVLAGDQGGDEEAGANLEDEKDDEAGNDDGQDGLDEDGNENGQDDPDEDEDVDGEDEVSIDVVGPACGDGNLDASEMCDDDNDDDGDGCSSACEIEVQGLIEILLTVDSLSFNEAPAEDSCSGTIDLLVGVAEITGSGRCLLDGAANTLDYVLDADLADGGTVEGELEIILNGDSHVPRIEGSLEDGVLYFEFNSLTRVTANSRVIWAGEQKAVLD